MCDQELSRTHRRTSRRLMNIFFLYFYFTHPLFFSFWTSRGWSQVSSFLPPRFLPSIFIAHRVQQSHCSSVFHQVLQTHALHNKNAQFTSFNFQPRREPKASTYRRGACVQYDTYVTERVRYAWEAPSTQVTISRTPPHSFPNS